MSRQPPRKIAIPPVLSAAECARRTGVTVRTLRVYERMKLLTPQRDAHGWRLYGRQDIQRLNSIITLKSLGLTLREIRAVLSTAPPPLTEVLQLQLESWLTRQAEAERALALLRAALARLAANDALSIEELCELVKSAEEGHSVRSGAQRELVNEMITPEEERTYLTWVAAHPTYARSMQAFSAVQEPLFEQLEALRVKGADPASPKVQSIVDSHSELMSRHGVRQLMVEMMTWNAALTRKYLALGARLRDRSANKASPQPDEAAQLPGGFVAFLSAAQQASRTTRALRPILEEAALLARQGVAHTSGRAQLLATRLADLCRRFKLGCPLTFALWTAFMVSAGSGGADVELNAEQQAPYRFLAEAVRALPTRRRRD